MNDLGSVGFTSPAQSDSINLKDYLGKDEHGKRKDIEHCGRRVAVLERRFEKIDREGIKQIFKKIGKKSPKSSEALRIEYRVRILDRTTKTIFDDPGYTKAEDYQKLQDSGVAKSEIEIQLADLAFERAKEKFAVSIQNNMAPQTNPLPSTL